jgi:hypothetical protein
MHIRLKLVEGDEIRAVAMRPFNVMPAEAQALMMIPAMRPMPPMSGRDHGGM